MIPCKDCITFAICKNLVDFTFFNLVNRCELIREFLDVADGDVKESGFYYGNMGNMEKLKDFFSQWED